VVLRVGLTGQYLSRRCSGRYATVRPMSGGWSARVRSVWRTARHNAIQVKNVVRSRWLLRRCDHIGHLSRLTEGRAIVDNRGTIHIGDRTRLLGRFAPIELRTAEGGDLRIGDRTLINYGTSLHVADSVVIGDDIDIGPYCVISDVEVGGLDSPDPSPPRPVVIHDRAWLATRVIVRPGSVIGEGTVVAAASVVDGVLPPHVVAAGSPARVVRHLDADGGTGAEKGSEPG
jgi:acetyltransferase-like isoleucine patch superfamily enzyme